MTTIKAKKDLHNDGQCFTKGQLYTLDKTITNCAQLMDLEVVNDLDQFHIIGTWWREFTIVN